MDGYMMQIRKRNYKNRKMLKDCAKAMSIPVIMQVFIESLTCVLGIITADTLGEFADAAFELDFSMGTKNAVMLVLCVVLIAVALPMLGMFSDFIMFNRALCHDNFVFGRYLDKKIEKAMELNSGEMQYELEDAPNTLRIQWVRLISKGIALPFCLGYFLYCVGTISWGMAGMILVIAFLKIVVPLVFKENLARFDKEEKDYLAKRRTIEADIIGRPYIIKMWEICKKAQDSMEAIFQEYYQQNGIRQIICKVFSEQAQVFIEQLSMVLLLFVGALLVAHGTVTPGEFASLFIYLDVSQTLLNDVGEIIQNYPLFINAAERVSEFYEDEESTSGESMKNFLGISGEQLEFSYGDKKIFESLDFEIAVGEKVGICGENGRGKTTLLKLLCASLESYGGKLKTGSLDFDNIHKKDWRNLIAVAPQMSYLFHATARENIIMGNQDVNIEEIDYWMKEFGIEYLTDRIIDGESDLSGGERQKISLVRALVKKAEVLVLDEPSNHLDQESIQLLKKYLVETSKTVIFITHDSFLFDVADKWIRV